MGGKFCEEGATSYTSRSIFDSLGNCYFIGYPNGYSMHMNQKYNKDTFNIKNDRDGFTSHYGTWKYSSQTNQVTISTHDSVPLVEFRSLSNQTGLPVKTFSAIDVYGRKVFRFRFFILANNSTLVPIWSDSAIGILKLYENEFDKLYIPGIDGEINTNELRNESELKFAIPSQLVIYLTPTNKHYKDYRKEIQTAIYTWKKPQLLPNGKYWLSLCDF